MIAIKDLQDLSKLSQELGSTVFSDKECAHMSRRIDNLLRAHASSGKTECLIDFESADDALFSKRAQRKSELIKFVLQDYIREGYNIVLKDAVSPLVRTRPELGLQPLSVPLSFTISWDPSKVA